MLLGFGIIAALTIAIWCDIIEDKDFYDIIQAIVIFTLFFKFVC